MLGTNCVPGTCICTWVSPLPRPGRFLVRFETSSPERLSGRLESQDLNHSQAVSKSMMRPSHPPVHSPLTHAEKWEYVHSNPAKGKKSRGLGRGGDRSRDLAWQKSLPRGWRKFQRGGEVEDSSWISLWETRGPLESAGGAPARRKGEWGQRAANPWIPESRPCGHWWILQSRSCDWWGRGETGAQHSQISFSVKLQSPGRTGQAQDTTQKRNLGSQTKGCRC